MIKISNQTGGITSHSVFALNENLRCHQHPWHIIGHHLTTTYVSPGFKRRHWHREMLYQVSGLHPPIGCLSTGGIRVLEDIWSIGQGFLWKGGTAVLWLLIWVREGLNSWSTSSQHLAYSLCCRCRCGSVIFQRKKRFKILWRRITAAWISL